MNKKVLIVGLFLVVVLAGIFWFFRQSEDRVGDEYAEDIVYMEETAVRPTWITRDPNANSGPWNQDLSIATSTDGVNFTGEKLFVPHAGVANLLYTKDGELISTFQYFSFKSEEMFDVIAYSISDDGGETWSPVKKVEFSGFGQVGAGGPNPVDPTLVQLEDGSFRLYFTFESPSDGAPQLYSAVSDTIDGVFESEGKQLTTSEMILDPAVAKLGDVWHHYTTYHGGQKNGQYRNVHSVSATGTNFEQKEDVLLDMNMLGNVIVDSGKLVFYGSGDRGVEYAISTDGYAWSVDGATNLQGADPGIAKLPSGKYVIVYTTFGN